MLFYLLDEIIGGISGVIVACIGTLLTCFTVKEFIDLFSTLKPMITSEFYNQSIRVIHVLSII